jgi:hypothetical protein
MASFGFEARIKIMADMLNLYEEADHSSGEQARSSLQV